MANRIYNLKTAEAKRSHGPAAAVVMGLNIDDRESLDLFMPEIAHKIVLQRTCSPPDTAILLISIIGVLSAEEFKARWLREVGKDKILTFYMSMMKEASVTRDLPDGSIIEDISLLPERKEGVQPSGTDNFGAAPQSV
jgi:hypothetical protein